MRLKIRYGLVVCGHHQDFWSKLMSSARQLINTVHVDMLIVRCATKKTNNRLVLSAQYARRCGRFIFAFLAMRQNFNP